MPKSKLSSVLAAWRLNRDHRLNVLLLSPGRVVQTVKLAGDSLSITGRQFLPLAGAATVGGKHPLELETDCMTRILCVLALAFVAPVSAAAAAKPFRIRVLCYNIHHGEGVDQKLDLERIAKVILSVSPDVVALQEVDRKTKRTNRVDQPAELARLTKMTVVFKKNMDFEGGQYGNAVLSKLPIARHKNVHLPSFDNGEQRGVLICELKPKSLKRSILFLCTHLDHRPNDRERLASAKRINKLIAQRGDVPAILAGDLNATRKSTVLKTFAKQWMIANEKELPTIPVTKPKRQIDFILSRPAGRWKTVEIRVLKEAIASDHRAIFAVLELQPSEKSQRDRKAIDRKVQPVIDELDKLCREKTIYMIGPTKAKRLAELVREKKPKLVVECGTAVGYSGLWIARELKAAGQGRLITIELDEDRAKQARENFKRAGLADIVEVRIGDARKLVREIKEPVDFLFIDCNFANYGPCFAGIKEKLATGAVVVADNVGVGASSMKDYLSVVRSKYQSRTEWFTIDLPWGKRDAMEVTVIKPKKQKQ